MSTNYLYNLTTSSHPTNGSVPESDIEKSCNEYYQNSTGFIIKDYEGIPENLLINIFAWFGLIVLFTFLRRVGDYGRFGLLKNDEERRLLAPRTSRYNVWTSKFFSQKSSDEDILSISDNELAVATPNEVAQKDINAVPSSANSTSSTASTTSDQVRTQFDRTASTISQDFPHSNEYNDKYFISWFINMFKLKDNHIKEKSGKDALYYIIFQRYLICYLFIITCLSIAILLPINILSGTAISDNKFFSKTTIINVSPGSSILWVHIVLSWVFLILGFLFMRMFSKKMSYVEGDYVSRTVLITNFPTKYCNIEYIYKHFAEAYPDLTVKDIQFAYDVKKLSKLHAQKKSMEIGRITSEKIYEQTNQRPMMHPFNFGSLFELCCCCCSRCFKDNNRKITDSIDFYTKNENELKVKIAEYREEILKKPLGILFVTFEDKSMAAKFLKDYHLGFLGNLIQALFKDRNICVGCYVCENLPKRSELSKNLRSDYWTVKYSTSPSNIKWENISKYGLSWWFRVVLINVVLFILMIFFTTPSILLDKMTAWGAIIDVNTIQKYLPDYLAQFLPSLLLRLLAALLPVLVAYTALIELHWTRSAENRSMMVKTFLLLVFMVLILPTLGLTSINAVFQWFKDNKNVKWRCVSDNGAFFIKYVTTCSLVGTALDLLRLPELLWYIIRLLWSRSSAERLAVRMQVAFEFDYGVQYAWILTVFTVTLCFSVVCPLITPFGLLYLILKHMVDRYNIYFAYISTKVDKRIHKTAVTFAIASFIMLQFCILFFIAVRNKGSITANSISTVQIVVITFSCIIFFGRLFFGLFRRFSPFTSTLLTESQDGSSPKSQSDSNSSKLDDQTSNNSKPNQDDFDKINVKRLNTINSDEVNNISSGVNLNEQAGIVSPSIPTVKNSEGSTKKRSVKRTVTGIDLQSPFIPSLLRATSSEYKLKLVGVNNSSSSTDIDPSNASRSLKKNASGTNLASSKPVDQSQVEIEIDNELNFNNRPNSPTTTTQPHNSYGALSKATNLFKKKKDSVDDSDKNVKELSGIKNESYNYDQN